MRIHQILAVPRRFWRGRTPNNIYNEGAFCLACQLQYPKEVRFCENCGKMVRHNSRHAKREKKYI